MAKKWHHMVFRAVLPWGSSWSCTYPLSGSPPVVECHEFCEPLFIQVKQQHQIQAGVHQLTLCLHVEEKARKFIPQNIHRLSHSMEVRKEREPKSRERPAWGQNRRG